jgi:chromosome partitioning protein
MMSSAITGSAKLQEHSDLIFRQLEQHTRKLFPPTARKTLRAFSLKEACEFIGVNQNSLRHTLRTNEEALPQGTLVGGTRRYFTADEINAIRDHLIDNDKLAIDNITKRRDGERACIISAVNLKGGVGKSTVASLLSVCLAARGYRVLSVDLDGQATLTAMMGITPELEPDMRSLYDVIRYDDPVPIRDVIRKTYFPRLDLIPCDMRIMEFEHETANHVRDPSTDPFFLRIDKALDAIRDDYDVILFDCPPQLSFAVMSAIFACTALLVPVTASMIDVMSLASFLNMTGEMMEVVEQRSGAKPYDWIKYLITRYEPTDQPQVQVASYLRSILGDSVMLSEFYKSTAIIDAANSKQTLLEVDPKALHHKTYDRAMESIRRVTMEIEGHIQKSWGRS